MSVLGNSTLSEVTEFVSVIHKSPFVIRDCIVNSQIIILVKQKQVKTQGALRNSPSYPPPTHLSTHTHTHTHTHIHRLDTKQHCSMSLFVVNVAVGRTSVDVVAS